MSDLDLELEADEPQSIFDICEIDTTAAEDGRWFEDIFDNGTGIDVKVRRLSSKPSMQVRRRVEQQYRKHLKKGKWDPDVLVEILLKQMAEAVVLDWRGILDKNKEPIEYSKENAYALMKKLPVFRDAIVVLANGLDNFRAEEQNDITKN